MGGLVHQTYAPECSVSAHWNEVSHSDGQLLSVKWLCHARSLCK
jgi:hypothetical protein